MSENIEVGNLVAKISFDDTGLNKSMAEIDRQMKIVKSEFDKASSALKGYGSEEEKLKSQAQGLNQQMQLQQQRINKLNAEFQKSAKEKGEDARETQNLAVKLNQAQTAYNNLENELKQVNAELEKQQQLIQGAKWTQMGEQLTAVGDKFKQVGQQMTDIGKDLSMKVTAPIVALGTLSTKAAIDFESSFAGVRKTVDATEEQFGELEKGIRDMAQRLPATASEIALVGEAAGQLGIKTDNLLEFTEVMIGLGEATTMSSDQAATELARLANITKMNQADFDKLGSSIVALGNNFATTEGEITAMALRLAGAGAQIGMSEADILGLSAALSSVGIEAEMGGSAISRVMVEMQMATSVGMSKVQELSEKTGMSLRDLQLMASNAGMDFASLADSLGMTRQEMKTIVDAGVDLENFAKIAGMSAAEFKERFEVDAIGALGEFVSGLGNAEAAGESAINMLTEMGITEIRLRDSLLRAGGANELFAESIQVSNQAWEENVALQNEVAQRYGTSESQLRIFQNRITEIGMQLGEILIPIILQIVDAITPWIERFGQLDQSIQKTILAVAAIVAAIGPALVIIGQITTGIGSVIKVAGAMSTAIGAAGGSMGVLKIAIAALTGPIGIVVAAIAGIVTTLTVLYNKNEDVRKFIDQTWASIVKTFQQAWRSIADFVMPIVDDLKEFIGDALGQIKDFWVKHGDMILAFVKPWLTGVVGFFKIQFKAIEVVISTAWTLIKAVIKTAIEAVKLLIKNGLDIITGLFDVFSKLLQGDWKGAWDALTGITKNMMENIMTFLRNIDLVQVGKDLINGLVKGIGSMVDSAVDTVKDVANSMVGGIKKALGIHSPSRVMMGVGEDTGEGLAVGLGKKKGRVKKSAEELAKATYDATKNWIDERKYYSELSLEQELKVWNDVASRYKAGTEQRKAADREIYRVKQEMIKAGLDAEKAAFDASKEWIDERKYYNKLSLDQELKAWQRVQQQYKVGSEQRKQADREVYRVQQEIIKAQQQSEKAAFDNSKKWIVEKKDLSMLSLTQELAAWERVQARYAEGTEERKQAEREVARVRQEIYNELKSASDDYLAKVKDVNERVAVEEQRLNEVYEQAVESRAKSIYSFAGLFDEVASKADVSGQQLVDNLRGQINVMVEWAAQLEQLAARGVDDGLIAELEQMGPKAAAEIAALNSLTDTELNEYQWLWKTKNQLAREQAVEELEGLKNETVLKIQELNREAEIELNNLQMQFETRIRAIRSGTKKEFNALTADMPKIGNEIINGLIKGMDSMKGKLQSKANEIANSVSGTIKKALDINSPSGVTTWLGEETGQGLIVGMGRKIAAVAQQARAMSTAATPSINSVGGGTVQSTPTGATDGFAGGVFAGATMIFNVQEKSDIDAVSQALDNKFRFATRGAGVK